MVTTQILLLSLVTVGTRLEPNLTSAISSKLFCSILVQVSNVVGDVFVVDKVVVEVEDSVNENKSSIYYLITERKIGFFGLWGSFGVFGVFGLITHIPVVAEGLVTNITGTLVSVVPFLIVVVGILVLVAVVFVIAIVVVAVVAGVVVVVVGVVFGVGLMVVVVIVVVPKTRPIILSSCS